MSYEHRQKAPLQWLFSVLAVVLVAASYAVQADPGAPYAMLAAALFMVVIGSMFGYLVVRDEGDRLAIRYGPLPAFRRFIAYADIASVEPSRSSWIDGWGIHYVPFRGWTYNLWGFDCVKLRVRGRVVRVGTDDVSGLTEFLRGRIQADVE